MSNAATGGEIIAGMLKQEGVDTAFGIPEGSCLSLCKAFKDPGIRLITPRHESIAPHMARGAFEMMEKKPGVVK